MGECTFDCTVIRCGVDPEFAVLEFSAVKEGGELPLEVQPEVVVLSLADDCQFPGPRLLDPVDVAEGGGYWRPGAMTDVFYDH